MLTLFQFPPFWNLPNASPFCLKMETYLRLAKIPYVIKVVKDPRGAPKGKLPFVRDENGQIIADSNLIIASIKKHYGDNLDNHLSEMQKAISIAVQRMMEEHLYWALMYARWIEPENWKIIKKDFFADMPPIIRSIVPELIRKKMQKSLYEQGMGRHCREDIYGLAKLDLMAINDLLGEQMYFFGDKPSSIDACLYGFLANILFVPINSPLKDYILANSQLVNYCERMRDNLFQKKNYD